MDEDPLFKTRTGNEDMNEYLGALLLKKQRTDGFNDRNRICF